MTIKRIIFIRPGETDWNRDGRWQGQIAIPINEHGIAQAKRLTDFIRTIGLQNLYTSDLARAVDTAKIIAETLGIEPQLESRLRERHMGDWQGLTKAEIKSWYADEYAKVKESRSEIIPGGESLKQVEKRVKAFFDDMMQNSTDETLGILSHTTAMRVILQELVPDFDPFKHEFSNISVTTLIRNDDGSWNVTQVNDISHLDGMETLAVGEVEET